MTSSPKLSRRSFLGQAAALVTNPASMAAQKGAGPKIYILWDMEGTSGVFTREQAWYWEAGVRENVAAKARDLFTADVNAVSTAALAAGASELIVCDTHHGGGNLVREKLSTDPRITYHYHMRGTEDGKMRWMPSLDRTVNGFMLPGHHAKAFTESSFMP